MFKKEKEALKKKIMDRVKIDPVTGCWNWKNKPNNLGRLNYRNGSKCTCAKRASFELFIGDIAESNYWIIQKCYNKLCVNPDHLDLFAHRENSFFIKKRARRICLKGHSLINAIIKPNGTRICRECANIRAREKAKKRPYEMICWFCEEKFNATYMQYYNERKGKNVFCSVKCRNRNGRKK